MTAKAAVFEIFWNAHATKRANADENLKHIGFFYLSCIKKLIY